MDIVKSEERESTAWSSVSREGCIAGSSLMGPSGSAPWSCRPETNSRAERKAVIHHEGTSTRSIPNWLVKQSGTAVETSLTRHVETFFLHMDA